MLFDVTVADEIREMEFKCFELGAKNSLNHQAVRIEIVLVPTVSLSCTGDAIKTPPSKNPHCIGLKIQ